MAFFGRTSSFLPMFFGAAVTPSDSIALHLHEFQQLATAKKVNGTGPWQALQQGEDGDHRNICNGPKQLPDLYLIGQQKCGTSSLAQDLIDAGVAHVHGPHNDKELHIFDAVTRLDYDATGEQGLMSNRAALREWMPDCPAAEDGAAEARRTVLADFTPAYLAPVPRPANFDPQGPWLPVYDAQANIPMKMAEMYGEDASPKLTIAVMIREPLSQMQSAWYHAESFDFKNVCSSCQADSFRAALTSAIQGLRQERPQITQWIWNVMYGRHLEEWLKHFKASQFYLIPTNIYSKGDNAAICRDLSQRLAFGMECSSESGDSEVTHAWSHEHPSLEEDAAGLREEFQANFMDAENERLLDLLAQASSDGMGLANYEGEKGDRAAIKAWLEAGW